MNFRHNFENCNNGEMLGTGRNHQNNYAGLQDETQDVKFPDNNE